MSLTYRWLGVAGLEFTYQNYTLLIDPFFTRPGMAAVLAGRRVTANGGLVTRHINRADAVLVTHPHYDHLLDVPEVMRQTAARAFGSPNTCTLLKLHGVPAGHVHAIQVGDCLDLGPFEIEVYPNDHTRIPFSRWLNGPLSSDLQNGHTRLPLRLSDYRMDVCFSFNIRVAGLSLLIGKHPVPANVLFISPYSAQKALDTILHAIRPQWIVPIHWDDFTRPLSLPLRPMLCTPAQGLRPIFPPVRRLDLGNFSRMVQRILPEVQVRSPEIFQTYLASE